MVDFPASYVSLQGCRQVIFVGNVTNDQFVRIWGTMARGIIKHLKRMYVLLAAVGSFLVEHLLN